MGMITPSWEHYGTHDDSAYPELWEGCVGAWCPGLGAAYNLHDFSGKGNTLQVPNQHMGWGIYGGYPSIVLDSVNDDVKCDGPRLPNLSTMAVVSWAYPTAGPPAYGSGLLGVWVGVGSNNRSWLVLRNPSNRYVSLLVSTDGSNSIEFIDSTAMPDNAWTCVVVNHRSGFWQEIYQNGKLTASRSIGNLVPYAGTAQLALGYGYYTAPAASLSFYGGFASQAIYNRTLGAEEVEVLSMHPGVAYTPRKARRFYSFASPAFMAAWAQHRSAQILGGGLR